MAQTILLAEDDPDILDIMYYLLSDAGYQVLKSSGEDTLVQAKNDRPDLVILDHRLQSNWGADICRDLKSDPATGHIAVILMSATMQLEETARKAGADDFLPKPFDMQALLDIVAKNLR